MNLNSNVLVLYLKMVAIFIALTCFYKDPHRRIHSSVPQLKGITYFLLLLNFFLTQATHFCKRSDLFEIK